MSSFVRIERRIGVVAISVWCGTSLRVSLSYSYFAKGKRIKKKKNNGREQLRHMFCVCVVDSQAISSFSLRKRHIIAHVMYILLILTSQAHFFSCFGRARVREIVFDVQRWFFFLVARIRLCSDCYHIHDCYVYMTNVRIFLSKKKRRKSSKPCDFLPYMR